AIYAYRTNDYGRAVDVAEQLLARNQGNALVLEVGGFSANRVANWPAAAKFWEGLSGLQKDRRGPRLQHAGPLMEWGEGGGGLDIVDTLLAPDPRSAELIRLKIAILTRRKDFAALDRLDEQLSAHVWAKEDAAQLVTIGAAFLSVDHPGAARRWLE